MDDCWRLAFAVAQWKQPRNPLKAEYGDDWQATALAYPHTAKQAKQVAKDFNTKTELPVTEEWSHKHPYVRLCVPVSILIFFIFRLLFLLHEGVQSPGSWRIACR